jgi:hypothetical protein
MKKGKVILVTGHRQWGKSETLKELAHSSDIKVIYINGQRVWIRHTSNDDVLPRDPRSYYKLIGRQHPEHTDRFLVIAFCPNTDPDTIWVLETLRENYDLIFWVIEESQNPRDARPRRITAGEIARLRTYGTVRRFTGKAEPDVRSRELRTLLERTILGG